MEIFKLSKSLGFTEKLTGIKICDLSLLAKWLREEHNIHVTSQIGNLDFISTYHYDIRYIVKNKFMCKVKGNFKTYEEAYEIGLQEALKLI